MPTTALEITQESVGNAKGDARVIQLNPKSDFPDSFPSVDQTSYSGNTATVPKTYTADSYSDYDYSLLAFPRIYRDEPKKSEIALRVIRTQYSKELIEDLKWLADNHEIDDNNSMPYISDLLTVMKKYFDNFFHDPFSSFLIALFDGLAHDKTYLSINKTAYQNISYYIEVLNNQDLDYKKIDKYISKLEDLGINITPY